MIVRELLTKIGFQLDDSQLKKADKAVKNFGKNVRQSFTALRDAGAKMTLFVTAPIVAMGVSALKTASDFEQLGVAFETMIGDADKAKKFMDELFSFAEATPFNIDNLQEASKRLLAYGLDVKEVIPTLTDLGNISSGVGTDKLPFLITALGQVRAKNVLAGEELKQFTETGVPLIEELAKVTGFSTKQITDRTKDLGITYEQVTQALKNMSTGNGKFADLMLKQSKTLGGVWSNLEDRVTRLKAEVGALFIEDAKKIVSALGTLIDKFRALSPQVKKGIVIFLGFLAVLGPILLIVGQIGLAIMGLAPIIKAIGVIIGAVFSTAGAIIAAVIAAIAGIYLIYDDIKAYIEGRPSFFKPVYDKLVPIINWIKAKWQELMQVFADIGLVIQEDVMPWLELFWEVGKFVFKSYVQYLTMVKDGFVAIYDWIGNLIKRTKEFLLQFEFVKKALEIGGVALDFGKDLASKTGSLIKEGGTKLIKNATGMTAIENIQKRAADIRGNPNSIVKQNNGQNGPFQQNDLSLAQQLTFNVKSEDPKEMADKIKKYLSEGLGELLLSTMRNVSSPEAI